MGSKAHRSLKVIDMLKCLACVHTGFDDLSPDKAVITVVSYTNLGDFLKSYSHVGVVGIACDEMAAHVTGLCMLDRRPLAKHFWFVSATPSTVVGSLTHCTQDNFLRQILMPSGRPVGFDRLADALISGRNPTTKANRPALDFICRTILSDAALLIRKEIAIDAAHTMPQNIDIFRFTMKLTSLAVVLRLRSDDVAIVPWEAFKDDIVPANRDSGCANGYVKLSDVRDTIHATRLPIWRGAFNAQNDHSKAAVFYRNTANVVCRCFQCNDIVQMPEMVFTQCCMNVFCPGCAHNKCAACDATSVPEVQPMTTPPSGEPDSATTGAWVRECMTALRTMRLSMRSALAAVVRIAIQSGMAHVVVFAQFPQLSGLAIDPEGEAPAAERIRIMERFMAVFHAAAPNADIMTLYTNEGRQLDKDKHAEALKTYKQAPTSGRAKVLVLNSDPGKNEQVNGLDLGVTRFLVSVGGNYNPQQAYSRAMRASSKRQTHTVTIVRLLQ